MAISAVSSISAGGLVRPSRLPRVEPIPRLAGREDAGPRDAPAPRDAATAADAVPAKDSRDQARLRAVDPRPAASIVAARLDELLGQKSAIEYRQAQRKSESSAEIVSELAQLKSRDAEVRAHEAAHMAAGGRYITGGASYVYQTGPDGAEYAVGGEVGIDTSPVPGNPEETAQKMRIVRAAALAPSDPSAADLSVAAAAGEAEAAAIAEIAQARSDAAAARYSSEATATPGTADAGRDRAPPRESISMVG